jgi:hypothetical protein
MLQGKKAALKRHSMSAEQLSRRRTVAALAATVACTLGGNSFTSAESDFPSRTQDCTGPSFSPTGPNAEFYGAKEGYPLPDIIRGAPHRGLAMLISRMSRRMSAEICGRPPPVRDLQRQ